MASFAPQFLISRLMVNAGGFTPSSNCLWPRQKPTTYEAKEMNAIIKVLDDLCSNPQYSHAVNSIAVSHVLASKSTQKVSRMLTMTLHTLPNLVSLELTGFVRFHHGLGPLDPILPHFPSLECFTCDFPATPKLTEFLSRHPTIKHFAFSGRLDSEYCFSSRLQTTFPLGIFRKLHTIDASPTAIRYFMGSRDVFLPMYVDLVRVRAPVTNGGPIYHDVLFAIENGVAQNPTFYLVSENIETVWIKHLPQPQSISGGVPVPEDFPCWLVNYWVIRNRALLNLRHIVIWCREFIPLGSQEHILRQCHTRQLHARVPLKRVTFKYAAIMPTPLNQVVSTTRQSAEPINSIPDGEVNFLSDLYLELHFQRHMPYDSESVWNWDAETNEWICGNMRVGPLNGGPSYIS